MKIDHKDTRIAQERLFDATTQLMVSRKGRIDLGDRKLISNRYYGRFRNDWVSCWKSWTLKWKYWHRLRRRSPTNIKNFAATHLVWWLSKSLGDVGPTFLFVESWNLRLVAEKINSSKLARKQLTIRKTQAQVPKEKIGARQEGNLIIHQSRRPNMYIWPSDWKSNVELSVGEVVMSEWCDSLKHILLVPFC